MLVFNLIIECAAIATIPNPISIGLWVIWVVCTTLTYTLYCCRGFYSNDELSTCVLAGNVAGSDWMLRKGAVLDPIVFSYGSNVEMVRMLIGHIPADVDVKQVLAAPLIRAIERNDLDMARLLLECGADPNLGEPTQPLKGPLFVAKSLEMVQLLVEAGADVTARGGAGGQTSVLEVIADRCETNILEYMADLVLKNNLPFEPVCLHFIRAQFVDVFVRLGSDVEDSRDNGTTALHVAAIYDDLAKLRVLLACNASVDARMPATPTSTAMPTPIELARSSEVATFLLAAGSKRGACTFEPSEDAIADAARQIARQRFDMIRARAFEICVALDSLELPALLMCVIIDAACAPFAVCVPFHSKWELVVAVKHRKKWTWSSARSDSDCDSWIIDVDE
jgi:ankyrin repeat protein